MDEPPQLDEDRLAEAAPALMSLTRHDGDRVWRQYPWSLTDRLFERGCMTDPKGTAESLVLTPEGRELASASCGSASRESADSRSARQGLRDIRGRSNNATSQACGVVEFLL